MFRSALPAILLLIFANPAPAQNPREEKVRNDKKKVESEGYWIYNDLAKGFAEAKKSGKPMMVVLRCLPCEECVKLDDEIIDADKLVKPLLEKFVRVRVVMTNSLDLSLFQFDTDQSFAVFFLNTDGTIYGRFGTRSHRTLWTNDVSVEGLSKAMSGALELHSKYPENKNVLAGKRGPAPEISVPEQFPTLKGKYGPKLDYEGNVVRSCIHCHQIGDAQRELLRTSKKPFPEEVLFPYPHPKAIGLIVDPKERATVLRVEPGSIAEAAGLQKGDLIRTFDGQPPLSLADLQWVLHRVPADGGSVKATVERSGKQVDLTLKLPKGWRQSDDISWRASSWGLRRMALGGMKLSTATAEERKPQGVAAKVMALIVDHVGQYSPHDVAKRAGFQKGDILLSFDGKSDLLRESDLLAYSLLQCKPGQKVEVTLLRNGKKSTLTLPIP